jgi:hypothetical protein
MDTLVGTIANKEVKGKDVRVALVLEQNTLRPFVTAHAGDVLLARYGTPESFRKLSVLGQRVLDEGEFKELETSLERANDQFSRWQRRREALRRAAQPWIERLVE